MNKLGLHIIGGTRLGLGRPRLVKLVDVSVEYVAQVRGAVGADCLVIVRWVQGSQPLDNPIARAQQFVARYQSAMLAMRNVAGPNIAFEGYNEVPDSEAAAYCAFEVERLRLMRGLGLRSVVGNWSVGTPNERVWPAYKPLLSALGPDDLVGLHEYWSDSTDLANDWHVGRWRRPEIAPYLAGRTLVITECGRDYTPDTGRGLPGWQQTCDAETFFRDLCRYNDEVLVPDARVVGATVFTTPGPGGAWSKFDPSVIWHRVLTYAGAEPPATPSPRPAPKLVIDGRCLSPAEFAAHVKALAIQEPYSKVVIHHTAVPTEASWRGATTIEAMRRYYQDQLGWEKAPHVFVAPEGIWLFWTLGRDGYGVTNGNKGVRHIEIVGNYSDHLPSGKTLDNAVAAAAALLQRQGLGIGALYHHKQLEPGTACPGAALIAKWPWFVGLVAAAMTPRGLPEDEPATDVPTMMEKVRWHTEEAVRELVAAGVPRDSPGMVRLHSLIRLDRGLMYRLEKALKAR